MFLQRHIQASLAKCIGNRFSKETELMSVNIETQGPRAVIKPQGAVVASVVQELRPRLKALLDQGVTEIVFDLATVPMVDSLGIGLLIMCHNSLQRVGGRMEVINACQDLLDEFRPMRLERHFSVQGMAAR
jgi:anti-anti-sigma factor